jgi:ABC-type multidrug transport system fused ATPase/permease subunit
MVGRPRIIVFDEATSALDNRTQAIVTESVARLEATRIVVAHRLSTVIDADHILVLDAGRLAEEGTHKQLMRDRNGLYYRFHQMQGANNLELVRDVPGKAGTAAARRKHAGSKS